MEDLLKLSAEFRQSESPDARGPRFAAVAYAIERQIKGGVAKSQLAEWLGTPDLVHKRGEVETWLYRLDHSECGLDRDEWYFFFDDGRLTSSAFNRQGINDLSKFSPPDENYMSE